MQKNVKKKRKYLCINVCVEGLVGLEEAGLGGGSGAGERGGGRGVVAGEEGEEEAAASRGRF